MTARRDLEATCKLLARAAQVSADGALSEMRRQRDQIAQEARQWKAAARKAQGEALAADKRAESARADALREAISAVDGIYRWAHHVNVHAIMTQQHARDTILALIDQPAPAPAPDQTGET